MYGVNYKKAFLDFFSRDTKTKFEKYFESFKTLPKSLLTDDSLLTILLQIQFWENENISLKEMNGLLRDIFDSWIKHTYTKRDSLGFINYYIDLTETGIKFESKIIVEDQKKIVLEDHEIEKFQQLLNDAEFVKSIENYLGNSLKNCKKCKKKNLENCWNFIKTKIESLPILMSKGSILKGFDTLLLKSKNQLKVPGITYIKIESFKSKLNIKLMIEIITKEIPLENKRTDHLILSPRKIFPYKEDDLICRFIHYIRLDYENMNTLLIDKLSREEIEKRSFECCLNTFEDELHLGLLINYFEMNVETHSQFVVESVKAISTFCKKNGKAFWESDKVSFDNVLKKYLSSLQVNKK